MPILLPPNDLVSGKVVAVCRSRVHAFSKTPQAEIALVAGRGVAGDTHQGVTVQHRSRVAQDPSQPNLRQVHLVHGELFDELAAAGFRVGPGDLGENVTTRGLALLELPRHTHLYLGAAAVLKVTGLRNPCAQLEAFQAGLLEQVVDKDDQGNLVGKAGIMTVVLAGGPVRPGDHIRVAVPPEPHLGLERV